VASCIMAAAAGPGRTRFFGAAMHRLPERRSTTNDRGDVTCHRDGSCSFRSTVANRGCRSNSLCEASEESRLSGSRNTLRRCRWANTSAIGSRRCGRDHAVRWLSGRYGTRLWIAALATARSTVHLAGALREP
jgi:hypothetical protein